VLAGRIHVTGGESLSPLKTFSAHDIFNPATGQWTTGPKLPSPRQGLVSGAVNGRWFVIGGGVGAGFFSVFTPADVVEVYDPSTP
jgi:hypothetical protein